MSLTTRRDFMKVAGLAPIALAPRALPESIEAAQRAGLPAQGGPADSRAEGFDYVVAGAGHNAAVHPAACTLLCVEPAHSLGARL